MRESQPLIFRGQNDRDEPETRHCASEHRRTLHKERYISWLQSLGNLARRSCDV